MEVWALAERLDAAATTREAWEVGLAVLADLGVAHAIWLDMTGPAAPRMRSTCDGDWLRDYAHAIVSGHDPFPAYCLTRAAPIRTGIAHLDRYPYLSPPERATVREASERTGMTAGVSLTMQVERNGRGQGWNLLTDLDAEGFEALFRSHGQAIGLAAHMIHGRLAADQTPQAPVLSALTGRERDCLRFVADGLRTAELAHRLGVSEGTVEYHLRNARRKLGARTRDHAVALALRAEFTGPGGEPADAFRGIDENACEKQGRNIDDARKADCPEPFRLSRTRGVQTTRR